MLTLEEKREILEELKQELYQAKKIFVETCRENIQLPVYSNIGDAGMDIRAAEDVVIMPGETKIIPNLVLSYTIDQNDLKNVRLDIGVVSQEIELFNMSIKNNLCLDKLVSDDEIISYLKELELNEILMFENGINTIVGEKGLKLSTGQKRRINILRSYLMGKNIYILDEPTSNLDKHTEEIVVNFILKYFKDKTLIIATHNEKINEICNKFYHFENHNLAIETMPINS